MHDTKITNNNDINNSEDQELFNFIKTRSYFPCNDIINSDVFKSKFATPNEKQINSEFCAIDSEQLQRLNTKDKLDTQNTHNTSHTEYGDFLQQVEQILVTLCNQINLVEKDKIYLVEGLMSFLKSFLHNLDIKNLEYRKILFFHLKKILGEDFQNKMLLVRRASTWLGINALESSEEYLNFLYKMADLGNLLSEDQGIKNEQHSFVLTKEEAKKERNALITDEKFKNALTNKMHPLHQEVLTKLRNLNNIIVS